MVIIEALIVCEAQTLNSSITNFRVGVYTRREGYPREVAGRLRHAFGSELRTPSGIILHLLMIYLKPKDLLMTLIIHSQKSYRHPKSLEGPLKRPRQALKSAPLKGRQEELVFASSTLVKKPKPESYPKVTRQRRA